jgi:hypothetical protein
MSKKDTISTSSKGSWINDRINTAPVKEISVGQIYFNFFLITYHYTSGADERNYFAHRNHSNSNCRYVKCIFAFIYLRTSKETKTITLWRGNSWCTECHTKQQPILWNINHYTWLHTFIGLCTKYWKNVWTLQCKI